jgi:tetratricopeptide (TPR) repeat protein
MMVLLFKYKCFEKGRMIFSGYLIAVLCLLTSSLNAQDQLDFKTVERETYRFYLQKEWDSLIVAGNRAISQGFDYFFLRQRLGIAYYEKENFRKASHQFNEALTFNAQDPATLTYQFYSYKFSNRLLEARYLRSEYANLLENSVQEKTPGIVDRIYFESGYTFSNNFPEDRDELIRRGSPYSERDLNGDRFYAQLGAGFNLTPKLGLYMGYSNLIISKLKQIQYPTGIIPPNPEIISKYNEEYKLNQHSLYINANLLVGKGYIITPAFHLLTIESSIINPGINDEGIPVINNKDTSFINYAASLSLSKNVSLFNFNLFGTFSNLNDDEQYQVGGEVTFFPRGNLDIYTTSNLTLVRDLGELWPVFDQLVGLKISSGFWMEGYFTLGPFINFVEKNAFVIHNSGDETNFRAGGNLIFPLSGKVELSVRYIFLNLESQTVWYQENLERKTETNIYQNHTILGGLKWNF